MVNLSLVHSHWCLSILSDGTPATQINWIVLHPTMLLLVTAHEGKLIRILDILTGMLTYL